MKVYLLECVCFLFPDVSKWTMFFFKMSILQYDVESLTLIKCVITLIKQK